MKRLAAAILAIALCGCGSEPSSTPASIAVEPGAIVLRQADSIRLVVRVLDQGGADLSDVPLTFDSEDTTRVKVSSEGVVKSVGDSGFVTVMVRAGDLEKQVRVTVVQIYDSLNLTALSDSLPQLGTLQLTASVLDPFGTVVTGASVGYSASNNLVSISASGLVTSQGPPGSVTITAYSGSVRDTTTVTIFQIPFFLYVSPSPVILPSGGNGYIDARVFDASGNLMALPIDYTPQDPFLVTIPTSFFGSTVQSLGPVGSTTVTVTSGQLTGSATVTVVPAVAPTGVDSVGGNPTAAAISPSGDVLVVTESGTVAKATLSNFTFTTILQGLGYLAAVAFSPSGTEAYVAGGANTGLTIIDVASGTISGTVGGITGPIRDIAVDAAGTVYLSADGGIYAIDPGTRTILDQGGVGPAVYLTLHPTAPLLYQTEFATGSIREISTSTLDVVRTIGSGFRELAISPDGSTLYSAVTNSEGVSLIDLATLSNSFHHSGCVLQALLLVPNPSALYLGCSVAGGINILDLNTGTITSGIVMSVAGQMALSPDGLSVVIPGRNGEILLIQ